MGAKKLQPVIDTHKKKTMPVSYTGGHRYITGKFHGGVAALYGQSSPDIVTVFTCQTKWPEIAEDLEPQHMVVDTADIIIQVYPMKLLEYLQKIKTGNVFGVVAAVVHTVEFQKTGLPHAHIFIWQKKNNEQGSELLGVDNNTPAAALTKTMQAALTEPLNLEVTAAATATSVQGENNG